MTYPDQHNPQLVGNRGESALDLGRKNEGIRESNESWSLPSGVSGEVLVTIGDWSNTFEIDDNTDTMVNAEAAPDVVSAMFAAMDKASAMTVTAGKAKPFSVSLTGSTKATNAFLTCAGIKSNAPGGGDNPFK
jgi:hypothetical protein